MSDVIVISGWEKYQHYKDRDPPWIKLYRDLLSAESWVLGTDDSRLVQVASMLLAVRYRNATPLNYALFRKVANVDMSESRFRAAVDHLASTEFLSIQRDTDARQQSASKPLATCTSETETETETETEQIQRRADTPRGTPARKRCPEDFQAPELERAKIRSECPDIDLVAEERKLRDHEFARGRSDWLATWRNWMREAQSRAASRPRPVQPAKRPPPTPEQIDAARREAAEANRRELAAKIGVAVAR